MDAIVYLRSVAALALVIGLILGGLWLVRRFGLGAMTGLAGGGRRLKVIESLPVDGRHRLVLVRRDGHEHLLLIGASSALVVESAILSTEIPPP